MESFEAFLGGWVIFWVGASLLVGAIAEATGREIGFGGGLVASLFLSPFLGAIFVATSRKKEDIKREQAILAALQRIAASYPELPWQSKVETQKKEIAPEGLEKINKLGEKLASGKLTQEQHDKEKERLIDLYTAL